MLQIAPSFQALVTSRRQVRHDERLAEPAGGVIDHCGEHLVVA